MLSRTLGRSSRAAPNQFELTRQRMLKIQHGTQLWCEKSREEREENSVPIGGEVDLAVSCSDGVQWNVECDSNIAVSFPQAVAVHELQR